jgi:phosphatidylethanolamine/phosphatidyl-N-methylethanolamine N-methyltransferase
VFCSIDDPVAGLRQIGQVLKPSGQVLLLEHVRPGTTWLARLFDLNSPLTRRTLGFQVNRDTKRNLHAAGLRIEHVQRWGIWREIVASRPR